MSGRSCSVATRLHPRDPDIEDPWQPGEDLGSSDRRNRIGETVPAIFGYLDGRVPRVLSPMNVQKPSTSRQSNLMHPANFTVRMPTRRSNTQLSKEKKQGV